MPDHFDQRFALFEPRQDLRQCRREFFDQQPISHVAATQPDNRHIAPTGEPAQVKIFVFCDDRASLRARSLPDFRITRLAQPDVIDVSGIASAAGEKSRQRRRQLRIDEQLHRSRSAERSVIQRGRGELQTSLDVFAFQVREIFQNFVGARARRELIEHVRNADALAADARTAATLLRTERDPVEQVFHAGIMPFFPCENNRAALSNFSK